MNVAKNSAPSTQHSALLPLIALHLAVTLPLAYLLNIWVDEASTLYTTENGFSSALQNALAQEKQAPLYFWVLSLWRALNGSVFFARLLSIIFSVAAIIVFQPARIVFYHGLFRSASVFNLGGSGNSRLFARHSAVSSAFEFFYRSLSSGGKKRRRAAANFFLLNGRRRAVCELLSRVCSGRLFRRIARPAEF
jgi:hypothetical protein